MASLRYLERFCMNLNSSSGQVFTITMKMEATNFSVMVVTALQPTWCHILPDRDLHLHYSGRFKLKCIHKVHQFGTIWTAILLGSDFIGHYSSSTVLKYSLYIQLLGCL